MDGGDACGRARNGSPSTAGSVSGLASWFALVGLSGAILVFEDPIDAWLNPQLLKTGSQGSHLSAQTIVERAESAYPLGLVEKIRFPVAEGEVYRLTLRVKPRRVGAERIEAMFDPVKRRVSRSTFDGIAQSFCRPICCARCTSFTAMCCSATPDRTLSVSRDCCC